MRRSISAPVVSLVLALTLVGPTLAISYGQVDVAGGSDGVNVDNVGALIQELPTGKFQICTGTLIGPTVFLTASHCIDDDGMTLWVSFDVHIAEPVTDANTDTLYEGTAHQHPLFDCCGENNPYDIAVVVLDGQGAVGITPAPLATANQLGRMTRAQRRAATFLAAGYGLARDTRQAGPQALYFDGDRRFATQTFRSLTSTFLTTSMNQATGDGGSCYGDSGGPHFLRGRVVAVTYTGDRWCKATDKSVRVDTPWARAFLDDFVTLP